MTSLQRYLGISLSIGILALWLAAAVISSLIVRHELDEAFDSALQEAAQRLLSIAALHRDDSEFTAQDGDSRAATYQRSIRLSDHAELLTYVVRDHKGNIMLVSHDADPNTFPEETWIGFRTSPTHRLYAEQAEAPGIGITIADPLAHRREAWLEVISALVVALPLLILMSFGLVWFIVRRSMRSVHAVRSQIESRSGANLAPLDAGDLPTELIPIAASVNRLMARLKRALESERSFASNSAHELRSPVAGALAQTQRLVAQLPEGEHRSRAHEIEASLAGIAKLSEKLMQLARAESGALLSTETADLFPVIELVLDEFDGAGKGAKRLHFQCQGAPRFMTRLDPDGMGILLRNVIENALKHSPAGSGVDVVLKSDANEICVTNRGAVVPPADIESLKTRFVRGSTKASGAGLGLAIVEAVTQGSDIKVELNSPATGRADGFEVQLKSQADCAHYRAF